MKFIKEYEITVAGDVPGIEGAIPMNHRIGICPAQIYCNTDDNYTLKMIVCTYKDGNYGKKVHNVNFPANEITVSLGETLPTSGIKILVTSKMNQILNELENVGANNYNEL